MHKIVFAIFPFMLFAFVFAACTPKPIEPEVLFVSESQVEELVSQGELLTINDFLDRFMTEEGNYQGDSTHYRSRSTDTKLNGKYLFAIDTINERTRPVYIRGRITTDDIAGNFYKSICIQQVVNGLQQALRISVDAGSIGGLFQMGQEILIRVDGLSIGRYANQPQLCVPSYNNNIYAQNYTQKIGWAPGRIPMAMFKEHTWLIGTPDRSKLHYDEYNDVSVITSHISLANDIEAGRYMDACLIRIKGVHFTGQYSNNGDVLNCTTGNPSADGNANVFAPTTNNVNYPQGRVIEDSYGNTFISSTSEYAKYARFYLPGANSTGCTSCAEYVGDIEGILGLYLDNAQNTGKYGIEWDDWSITARSLDDIHLANAQGQLWPRIEYGE